MPLSMPSAARLRVEPVSYMKSTLERFKLGNMLESENSKDKLAQAGYPRPGADDRLHVLPLCHAADRLCW